ncbi:hypothetical protein [uncultured Helcococcus sp.]|uniref:hypothetical protein n=1 Tax=uncultured Helcococcus sp. TaxID=1072508 RepID=UPI0026195FC0|nr:hypothetical protein [uncultured Helcococcus sp.]
MKKLILTMALLLTLTACSSDKETVKETKIETGQEMTENKENDSTNAYTFEANGVKFTTGDKTQIALDALGKYNETLSAPSCAFEGEDTVYKYDGLEIYSYDKNGEEYISGIFLLEDTSTPEGLKIGSSKEDMIKLYGEDFTENIGSYTYNDGKTNFIVVINDDKVVSISYIIEA